MRLVETIREAWGWTGLEPEEVVGENDFGNLMIKDTEGKYWRICPEDLWCKIVANDRSELDKLSADQKFLEDWHMEPLVEKARAALGELQSDQKFYLVIPSVVGGAYDISNIKKISLIELISSRGNIAYQIRDLPDGTNIEFEIVE